MDNKKTKKTRISWNEKNQILLSKHWGSSDFSMNDVLEHWSKLFPNVKLKSLYDRLKKQANRMGITWTESGVRDAENTSSGTDDSHDIKVENHDSHKTEEFKTKRYVITSAQAAYCMNQDGDFEPYGGGTAKALPHVNFLQGLETFAKEIGAFIVYQIQFQT